MIKKCPLCGESFECYNSTDCWCMNLSKLPQNKINDYNCLCKECLKKLQEKSK